ncbi:hypothetical protein [Yoonia sp. 2307UL14-13]|uniref:hypothetical protein n=1 Tax=Yoonia sp. 2307UL14-13 TaxID=3126506 RepID=UPI00309F623A
MANPLSRVGNITQDKGYDFMDSLIIQILLYMSCTFLLGLALGWFTHTLVIGKATEPLTKEVAFWRKNLDQSRREHDVSLRKLEALKAKLEKQK